MMKNSNAFTYLLTEAAKRPCSTSKQGGLVGRLLKIPGMSAMAAFRIILPYRFIDGIVVLQK